MNGAPSGSTGSASATLRHWGGLALCQTLCAIVAQEHEHEIDLIAAPDTGALNSPSELSAPSLAPAQLTVGPSFICYRDRSR